jgi:hypothetical protein
MVADGILFKQPNLGSAQILAPASTSSQKLN